MLQNGGSSGAAATVQQEMNSDIRAMDLGATTASWEIMALRREMTHVTPRKPNPEKYIYNPLKWHSGHLHCCANVLCTWGCFQNQQRGQFFSSIKLLQSAANLQNANNWMKSIFSQSFSFFYSLLEYLANWLLLFTLLWIGLSLMPFHVIPVWRHGANIHQCYVSVHFYDLKI